jgi:cell division septum initiation protein DivIVA
LIVAYNVGQVLFVILEKQAKVYPMMVVEEITKRTMRGEETNYVLQGGSDPTATVLATQVAGEIFESAEEAKYVLTSRATAQVERMVDAAIKKAEEWYGQRVETSSAVQTVPQVEETEERVQVQLPDGTVAYVKNFSMTG